MTVGPGPLIKERLPTRLIVGSVFDISARKDFATLSVMRPRPNNSARSSSTTMSDPELYTIEVWRSAFDLNGFDNPYLEVSS